MTMQTTNRTSKGCGLLIAAGVQVLPTKATKLSGNQPTFSLMCSCTLQHTQRNGQGTLCLLSTLLLEHPQSWIPLPSEPSHVLVHAGASKSHTQAHAECMRQGCHLQVHSVVEGRMLAAHECTQFRMTGS
jgi:hypothetical protein